MFQSTPRSLNIQQDGGHQLSLPDKAFVSEVATVKPETACTYIVPFRLRYMWSNGRIHRGRQSDPSSIPGWCAVDAGRRVTERSYASNIGYALHETTRSMKVRLPALQFRQDSMLENSDNAPQEKTSRGVRAHGGRHGGSPARHAAPELAQHKFGTRVK